MDEIRLIEPSMNFADDIWHFRQEVLEFDSENEDQFAGCSGLRQSESAEAWIHRCELMKDDIRCKEVGISVPSHMYLAVREKDNRIVGIIDLRHHINHPVLGTWGGHCGYTVRPDERGNGYAKKMLQLNLEKARGMGIKELLVTCDSTNYASEKTILYNGGRFEKEIDVDGVKMKRYWVSATNFCRGKV